MFEAAQGAFGIPLLFFVFLGYSLNISRGHFNDVALILISVGWLAFVSSLGLLGRARGTLSPEKKTSDWMRIALWAVLLFFNYKLLRDSMVHYIVSKEDHHILHGFLWGGFGLALVGFLGNLKSEFKFNKIICILLAACLFLARIFVLRASPTPWIDVFTVPTLGSQYLLQGLNPYAQSYPDIYHGAYGYAPAYAYWPGIMYPETLSWLLFKDIRVTFIISDLITFFCLKRILDKFGLKNSLPWLVPAVWLSFPPALFVLEQAWIDPLIIACSAVFLLLVITRRWAWAGVMLGYLVSIKQYTVFFGVLGAIFLLLQNAPKKDLIKAIVLSAVTFLVALVPFAIWDWESFRYATFDFLMKIPLRTDALTWVAAIQMNTGWSVPGSLMSALYAIMTAVALALVVRSGLRNRVLGKGPDVALWTYGLVLVYGTVFLVAKQAFCNYYYLLSFFVCLHWLIELGKAESPGVLKS